MNKTIYFEPAGQILSSHRSFFENPPEGYEFVLKSDDAGSRAHKLLNTYLYKFGFGSLPWHIIKPKIESFLAKPPNESCLTFAWNHVIFRNEPWIIHVEWSEMLTGFSYFWFRKLRDIIERRLISDSCKKIITWSNIAAKSFELNYPSYQKFAHKIEVIPLAVPVKRFHKPESNITRFLFIGSIMKGREDYNFHLKGGKEVFEAFGILNKKHQNIELVVRSEVPEEYKREFSQYENVEIIDNWLDWRQLEQRYIDSDVFLFPGHDTPFGVILEAMGYEMPVIATDVYGNSELVEDSVTGFIIKPSRFVKYFNGTIATRPMTGPRRIPSSIRKIDWDVVDELVEKMQIFAENPELRRKMGKKARESVESGIHSIRHRNAKLKKIFDEAIK